MKKVELPPVPFSATVTVNTRRYKIKCIQSYRDSVPTRWEVFVYLKNVPHAVFMTSKPTWQAALDFVKDTYVNA